MLDGGNQIGEDYIVNKNLDVFAHWEPITITVTFVTYVGTCNPEAKTVKRGGKYGTLPTPVADGYEFEGWFKRESTVQIMPDTIVTEYNNHDLIAHWKALTCEVTFSEGYGATLEGEKTKIVRIGEPYGTLPIAQRDGYLFLGWFTTSDDTTFTGVQITANTIVERDKSHTLYARYEKSKEIGKEVTVTYDPNGGVLDYEIDRTLTALVGSIYGVMPEVTREGYEFEGWFTAPTGGTYIDSDTIVTIKTDHTLYAHWKKTEEDEEGDDKEKEDGKDKDDDGTDGDSTETYNNPDGSTTTVSKVTGADGSTTEITSNVDKNGDLTYRYTVKTDADGKKTTTMESKNTTSDGSVVELNRTTYSDQSYIEKSTVSSPDGSVYKSTRTQDSDGATTEEYTLTTKSGATVRSYTETEVDGSSQGSKISRNASGALLSVEVNTLTRAGKETKLTYKPSGNGIMLSSVSSDTKKFVVPASVDPADGSRYDVVSIGAGAFKGNSTVTSVNLPKSVRSIEKSSFQGTTNLKSFVMKTKVSVSVQANTFKGDKNLTTITITGAVKSVAGGAFKGIAKNATITVGKGTSQKVIKKIQKQAGSSVTIKIK